MAFMATVNDREFLDEANRVQLSIDPTSGEEMEQVISGAYNLPPATIEKVRRALTTP
jgi:hypothetical protein